MDLPKCAEFTGTRLKGALQDLAAAGLGISDLGASAQMHEPDPAKRAKHMDEARRFIALAHELHAPYVRVFPNQFVPGEDKHVTFARISDGLHELGEYARPAGVTIIVESHGEFRRGEDLIPILEGAKSKNVAFLWDAHHTCVEGEKPADTFQQLGKYTRHTHLKDSVPIPGKPKDDRHYVLTGNRRHSGSGDRAGTRQEWVQGLLLLRMGKTLASRDRGAGSCVSALRKNDAGLSGRSGRKSLSGIPPACSLSNRGEARLSPIGPEAYPK